MQIKLEPCYPPGQTSDQQIEKVKAEYREFLESHTEDYHWKEQASELLDVAQTIEGLADILDYDLNYHIYNGEKVGIKEINWRYYVFDALFVSPLTLKYLRDGVLNRFWGLVEKNDRGNGKYGEKLAKQLIQQHREKLKKRRKEWSA